jgi:hypothetical protein
VKAGFARHETNRKDTDMGVLISAMSSTPREFTSVADADIDTKSFSLSQGNWFEHLFELFLSSAEKDEESLCVDKLSAAVDDYLGYHAGKVGLSENCKWHLGIAGKLQELIKVARTHGCDRIGIAG